MRRPSRASRRFNLGDPNVQTTGSRMGIETTTGIAHVYPYRPDGMIEGPLCAAPLGAVSLPDRLPDVLDPCPACLELQRRRIAARG